MLDPELSRQRQGRLLEVLQRKGLDAAVVGLRHHVHYFSGFRPQWVHQSAFVLFSDGRSWMTSGGAPKTAHAADEVKVFESSWYGTRRQEQAALAAELVMEQLTGRGCRRIGVDASAVTSQVVMRFNGGAEAIDGDLWQMRRRKDADELRLMKSAIRCSEAMYAKAREIIAPGIEEVSVFCALQTAAVAAAGEPLSALLGNDFACGGGGGSPRSGRAAKPGEIFILDLGPAYRGYYADNCRSLAVNHEPSDAQLGAWRDILESLKIVESLIKPGARGREIFAAVDQHLKSRGRTGLPHHLGHGVGLEAHEYPHLNPKWDDKLMEGEVISVEPGIYGPELSSGMRIENQYLVTSGGVENLTPFAMELA